MLIEITPSRAQDLRAVFPQCRREDFRLVDNCRWSQEHQDGTVTSHFIELWEITGPSESLIALKFPNWRIS